MHKSCIPSNGKLARLIHRVQKELHCFETSKFYHVLRGHNKLVDQLANSPSRLDEETLKRKSGVSIESIPQG
jgi:hypothetical protein